MRIIETTAHVGSDGMLRVEVPIEQRDRDVNVALIIESPSAAVPKASIDKWASVRNRLEIGGLRVPLPGLDNPGPVEPESLPGVSASQVLIRDRR